MPAANLAARTTRALNAYRAPYAPGQSLVFVKTLPAGSAFDIKEIRRVIAPNYNKVWVKSGANDWYQYEEGYFQGRINRLYGAPVHISPAGPSGLPAYDPNNPHAGGRKPHPGSMYIAFWELGAWWAFNVQPYV